MGVVHGGIVLLLIVLLALRVGYLRLPRLRRAA
jgi:hypothetical protein